jgi:hypothetical protein
MKWGLTAILSAGILRERQSPLPDIQPGCDAVVAPSFFRERATKRCNNKNG